MTSEAGLELTPLRRRYNLWSLQAYMKEPEAIRETMRRLRAYIARPGLPQMRKYLASAKLDAYKWAYVTKTGDGFAREEIVGDIPAWSIPGLQIGLPEPVTSYFWASWPAVTDGVVCECSAIVTGSPGHQYWWTWRGARDSPKEFVGMYRSFGDARRETGASGLKSIA